MQTDNHHALFMVAGIAFKLPISWITYEERQVQNHVQASEQANLLPAVCMSHNQLIIELEIPSLLHQEASTVALLKSYLLKHSQLWSSLKYQSESFLGQSTTTIPFTGITLASQMPYITGYLGARHYLLGSMLSHFSVRYQPKTLMEQWRLHLDALNLSLLRQSTPKLLNQELSSAVIAQSYSKYSMGASEVERYESMN